MAYKLASEFIKRTSSAIEPYLQMVRQTSLLLYTAFFHLVVCDQQSCPKS